MAERFLFLSTNSLNPEHTKRNLTEAIIPVVFIFINLKLLKIYKYQKDGFNKMKKIIFILISLFIASNIFAQWQPDVRLTYDPAQSYMSGPHQKDIASNGNVLHVVWHDERTNWDIYYKRSTDERAQAGVQIHVCQTGQVNLTAHALQSMGQTYTLCGMITVTVIGNYFTFAQQTAETLGERKHDLQQMMALTHLMWL